jgi:uncharacterized membrane protein YgcG
MSSSALGSSLSPTARVSAILVVLFLLISSLPLFADSHARIVRLSYVDGDVELDKGDGRSFNTAYMNMPISHGWRLWARDGQAEAEFEDGSSIRLTPDTLVVFSDLSLDSNGGRRTSVELQQGTAYFDIRHRDQDSFQLVAGRDRIELSKSAHFRASAEKHQVELAVLSGEAQISNGSASGVAVRKGETIHFDDDDPSRYYLAKSIDADDYDKWDNERVKNHDEVVSTGSVPGTNTGLVYGLSDLNTYGDYFFVPGYGYMWRPASASLAWDPFSDGYWVSYPGSGYLFVSSYPWGWAPYRYGSWHFVNGRGWCWAPGNHWNSWHAVPPVHNLPPNFHHPEVPHHGPPVIAINGGRQTPVPPGRIVIDNDALEHHWPHSVRDPDASRQILRQAQSQAAAPASGLVSGSANAPGPVVGTLPATTVVSGSGRTNQMPTAQTRADALRDERMQRDQRNVDFMRARQATQQTAPSMPSVGRQSPFGSASAAASSPVHASPAPMSPRMESHAPAMRPMASSPSMAPSHSASPSFSGGSMSRGASAGGGSGGGGHSGGNHR